MRMKAAVPVLLQLVVLWCLCGTEVQAEDGENFSTSELRMELGKALARIEALQNDVSSLKTENSALRNDVSDLKTQNSERKVAFSASLGSDGDHGPVDTETRLVFTNIESNIGQHYSSTSGVFTAPLHGLYYFRFTAFEYRDNLKVGVKLYHNGRMVLWNDKTMDGTYQYISNGVAVELQGGDEVYMNVPPGRGFYDNKDMLTTFTGFLLFPM